MIAFLFWLVVTLVVHAVTFMMLAFAHGEKTLPLPLITQAAEFMIGLISQIYVRVFVASPLGVLGLVVAAFVVPRAQLILAMKWSLLVFPIAVVLLILLFTTAPRAG